VSESFRQDIDIPDNVSQIADKLDPGTLHKMIGVDQATRREALEKAITEAQGKEREIPTQREVQKFVRQIRIPNASHTKQRFQIRRAVEAILAMEESPAEYVAILNDDEITQAKLTKEIPAAIRILREIHAELKNAK
jgi:hypothetical protein